ncbi:MAG: hypothetical protein [Wendovervirus sonii]|uniref:Transmembrane protein n=1 Tax=phage Lak_Megaphage_Sonny TaxID=3109229 RepID=A0ABZ0Z3H0_9CAUD|nr:MAG: hypothetical protein [phage Lak_Megaphage_Sonny]
MAYILSVILFYIGITVGCIHFAYWMHTHLDDAKIHDMLYVDKYRFIFYLLGVIPIINAIVFAYLMFKYVKL